MEIFNVFEQLEKLKDQYRPYAGAGLTVMPHYHAGDWVQFELHGQIYYGRITDVRDQEGNIYYDIETRGIRRHNVPQGNINGLAAQVAITVIR